MSQPIRDFYRIPTISQVKKIPSSGNKVLARVVDRNEEATTPSGVLKVGDIDFQPAVHANRISEIIMVPDTLNYHLAWHKRRPGISESMPWKTEVEIQPGDIVWHDYMDSLNCPMIIADDEPGERYKLLNYYDLYVAKRIITDAHNGDSNNNTIFISPDGHRCFIEDGKIMWIIPLNGYLLCEEVLEERQGKFDVLDKHVDKRLGKIAFIGKKNEQYRWEQIGKPPKGIDKDGNEILEVGDIIIKKNPDIHIMLEDILHARFNGSKLYFIIQRKDIYAKKL